MEMGKFEPKPYLEEVKAEIDISYPSDILDIIVTRKAVAKASISSSGVCTEPGSATPKPALQPAYLPSIEAEVGISTFGK